eukprot:2297174-Rhodomonas_salina.1
MVHLALNPPSAYGIFNLRSAHPFFYNRVITVCLTLTPSSDHRANGLAGDHHRAAPHCLRLRRRAWSPPLSGYAMPSTDTHAPPMPFPVLGRPTPKLCPVVTSLRPSYAVPSTDAYAPPTACLVLSGRRVVPGGHPEVLLENVRVPAANIVLGE